MTMQYLLFSLLITFATCTIRKFPKDFAIGAASCAYQFEGAWNEDGKGPSIWDFEAHQTPTRFRDRGGDVATDMYHRYKEDVKLMSYLGLDSFRFSFSWPRILPTGFPNNINRAGIEYYNNFIDELIQHNITPSATIYHWDLPQTLQELGGWANPNAVEWFEDYAKVVFNNFGDKVKMWVTINEPVHVCWYGYGIQIIAPFVNSLGIGEYMCLKNVLLAHARAYHLYHTKYNEDAKGIVGIAMGSLNSLPLIPSHDAEEINLDVFQFTFGVVTHPIFSEFGDFPEVVRTRVGAKSSEQGFPRSRLPELTRQEVEYIKGTADFLGINTYLTFFVLKIPRGIYPVPSLLDDLGIGIIPPDVASSVEFPLTRSVAEKRLTVSKLTNHYARNLHSASMETERARWSRAERIFITKIQQGDAVRRTMSIGCRAEDSGAVRKVLNNMTHDADPKHFYKLLLHIKETYNNPTVYITENGWSNTKGGLEDDDRIEYLAGHIDAMLEAVDQGCDVRGYSVWSLMDNYQWDHGYSIKYGLYEVDFTSPNLTRTPRKSAYFYKSIIESRGIERRNIIY